MTHSINATDANHLHYEGGKSCTVTDQFVRAQLESINPINIVDFGAGAGKLGELCREVLGSSVRITAVEGFIETVHRLQSTSIYDAVEHSLMQNWISSNKVPFDLAIFGDVLEHVTRREAFWILDTVLTQSPNVIVNIPLRNLLQDEVGGNVLEEHRAYFTEECFTSRYAFREKHSVMPDVGYVMFNGWIVGRSRRSVKNWLRDSVLKYGGRRARWMMERFGFDCYPRIDV